MIAFATTICLVLALATVVVTGVRALRDEPVTTRDLIAPAALELALLLYVGVRVADLLGGHRPPSLAIAIAYLVGILLVMPVAALLGLAERSRWGPAVVGAGALVVCVLFARVTQVWTSHG